ncbi:MAG: hypothetical protein LQ350_004523 [Teloschistes chrysophthalmus]|nr:MAG: hypothetical protein LQ350_004523 [Niorma chrysophthalma]
MAESRCSIVIKRGCSIVVKQSIRAEVIVTRDPVLTKCDCHQPEYHQIQLQAIKEVIEACNRREQIHIHLRKLFAEIILRTRAYADTLVAEYLQMEKEDMKRFTGLPQTLEGQIGTNGTGSDGFDLQKAEAAITEFIAERVHLTELYLSNAQRHLRKMDECSRRVEPLVCSPYVPRHLDALGLVVETDTKDQQSKGFQPPNNNKDSSMEVGLSDEVPVLESNARDDKTLQGYWRSTQVMFRFTQWGCSLTACLDTGAGLSLLDWALFNRYLPLEPMIPLEVPLIFKGISEDPVKARSYITVPIFLPGRKADGTRAFAKLCRRKIYIVDKLSVGLLIATDMIGPERITIDIAARKAKIGSCGVEVLVQPLLGNDPKLLANLRLTEEESTNSTLPSCASNTSNPSAKPAQTLASDNESSPIGLIQKRIMDHEIRTTGFALDQRLQELHCQEQHCRNTMMPMLVAHLKVFRFWAQYNATDAGKRFRRARYECNLLKRYSPYIPSCNGEHLREDDGSFMLQKVRETFSEWYWGPEVLERIEKQTLPKGPFLTIQVYGLSVSELMAQHREEDGKLKSVMRERLGRLVGGDGKVRVEELVKLMG